MRNTPRFKSAQSINRTIAVLSIVIAYFIAIDRPKWPPSSAIELALQIAFACLIGAVAKYDEWPWIRKVHKALAAKINILLLPLDLITTAALFPFMVENGNWNRPSEIAGKTFGWLFLSLLLLLIAVTSWQDLIFWLSLFALIAAGIEIHQRVTRNKS